MRTDAGDAADVEHHDLVCGEDGAHPLRHHDNGGVLQLFPDGKPHRSVRFEIQRGKAVVKDIDPGAADQRPRDGDPLLLTAGKVGAALADVRVQAFRQRTHKIRRLRQFQRAPDLRVRGVRHTEADVFPYGAAEKRGRLRDIADQAVQRLGVHILHVHAVHFHAAGRCVVQPGDQIDKGGFAAAGAADYGRRLSGQRRKGDVPQDRVL